MSYHKLQISIDLYRNKVWYARQTGNAINSWWWMAIYHGRMVKWWNNDY